MCIRIACIWCVSAVCFYRCCLFIRFAPNRDNWYVPLSFLCCAWKGEKGQGAHISKTTTWREAAVSTDCEANIFQICEDAHVRAAAEKRSGRCFFVLLFLLPAGHHARFSRGTSVSNCLYWSFLRIVYSLTSLHFFIRYAIVNVLVVSHCFYICFAYHSLRHHLAFRSGAMYPAPSKQQDCVS